MSIKIILGICAMEEKLDVNKSNPINPLAIKYSELRKPYEINHLKSQRLLTNRKSFYQMLEKNNIPTPRKIYIVRESNETTKYVENEDFIECNGERIYKPFIEKPFDAEDHNINIYYPKSQGGGCRRLFRKVGNNSSIYLPEVNNIRTNGSYIYEEFVTLDDAKDVKVYSTPTQAYAELRKSPSVDGHVERNCLGKEKRTETNLSELESRHAIQINRIFRQFICGFDILRTKGVSYICDVNGWSMVKGRNQNHFYDEASRYLRDILKSQHALNSANNSLNFSPDTASTSLSSSSSITNSLSSSSNSIYNIINVMNHRLESNVSYKSQRYNHSDVERVRHCRKSYISFCITTNPFLKSKSFVHYQSYIIMSNIDISPRDYFFFSFTMGSTILFLTIVGYTVSVVSGADVLFKDPSKRIQNVLNICFYSLVKMINDYVTALEYNNYLKK
ncbi:hypothetical protein PPL_10371, partial [Heterostelium album PN500]